MVDVSNIVSFNSARNLGVVFDKCIELDYHLSSACKSTYFNLRNIGGIRSILSNDACAQLIHSLVTVRLDYCNSILYGLLDNSLYRLQKIQNTAARILSRLPRFSQILATLFDLHWLPIRYRITFNICILIYRAYHHTAPSHICDLIVPYVNTRSLRSNDKCLIKPCKPRLRSYGERCFKYAGPQEWNKLPIHIRKSSFLSIFKTQLKTYLFQLAYPSSWSTNVWKSTFYLSYLIYTLHLFIIILILTTPLLLPSQSCIFTSYLYFTLIYNMYILLYHNFYFYCTLTCFFVFYRIARTVH